MDVLQVRVGWYLGGFVVSWVLVVVGELGTFEGVGHHRLCSVYLEMFVGCVWLFGLRYSFFELCAEANKSFTGVSS